MKKIGYNLGKDKSNNVFSFISEQAQTHPEKAIFKWKELESIKSLSYKEFEIDAAALANGLSEIGILPEDRVIVFLPVSVTMYKVLASLQYLGATPVFFDNWTRKLHLQTAIQQIQPKAMISFTQAFAFFANSPLLDQVLLKIEDTQLPFSDKKIEMAKVDQEQSALITFTTGSSGLPKAANRSHRFLAAQHYALSRYIHYSEDDIDLTSFPIFSLNAIASGVTSIIPAIDIGTPKEDDGKTLYNQISEFNVTNLTLSPALLNNLSKFCKNEQKIISSLKSIITGGAPISFDELNSCSEIAPNSNIQVLYGSTEVEPISHISLTDLKPYATQLKHSQEGILVGKIDQELEYKVIHISQSPISNIQEVLPNDVGELIVSGEHVCSSYYNNPEAFQKTKVVDAEKRIWHRTGDLVRIDPNQNVWLLGRVHNVIHRRGEYLFPIPIETELKKLEFIKHVAYIGIWDQTLGEKALVVIEPIKFEESNIKDWKEIIAAILIQNNFINDQVVFVKDIPMDPRHHSKVEYNLLRTQLTNL